MFDSKRGLIAAFFSLAFVLTACDGASVSSVSFTAVPQVHGQITVSGKTYDLEPGHTVKLSSTSIGHVDLKLTYTELRNEDPSTGARVAVITSEIDIHSTGQPTLSHGTVTLFNSPSDLPARIANCDSLIHASAGPDAMDPKSLSLSIDFSDFKAVSSCTPEKGVNLALYNPLLIAKRDPSEGLAVYTVAEDEARGKEFVREYLAEYGMLVRVQSDRVSQYIQNIAERIVAASDLPNQKVSAYVVDMDNVNAFAVPGGYVFVDTGLIRQAGSEAALAGVLGHEWSHVTCRHSSRVEDPIRIIEGKELEDQRNQEYEADAIGSQYAWNAGWEPFGMADLLEMLFKKDPSKQDPNQEQSSNHPADNKRADRVNTYAQLYYPGKAQYVHTTADYEKISASILPSVAPIPHPPVVGKNELPELLQTQRDFIQTYEHRVEQIYQRHFGRNH